MTTIIAKEVNGKVTFGYDSLCTGGDSFELEREKVFSNNGIIFGIAGRLLLNAEFKHANFPTPPKNPQLTDKYVTVSLMPHIRRLLNELAPRRSEDEFSMQILVVVNNRIYEIGCDTSWMRRVDGLYAIGSGSPVALGALKHGASIEEALVIAAENDPYTGGRLTVANADTILNRND